MEYNKADLFENYQVDILELEYSGRDYVDIEELAYEENEDTFDFLVVDKNLEKDNLNIHLHY